MSLSCSFTLSRIEKHANETGHIPIWSRVKFIDRDPPDSHIRSKRLSI